MFALFSLFSFVLVLTVNAQDECNKYGGVCVKTAYCHESLVIRSGLCADASQTCCLGANCYKDLGGECSTRCPESIIGMGARAVDCPIGTSCCVWL